MPIVNLIRFVEISHFGTGSFILKTNIPGPDQAVVCTIPLVTAAERRTVRYTLPGNTRAIEYQARLITNGAQDLGVYTCRLYCKALGVGRSAWKWISVPIPGVSEEWTSVPLPIPPTPEDWTKVALPIPPTPEEWSKVPIVNGRTSPWQWIDVPGGES